MFDSILSILRELYVTGAAFAAALAALAAVLVEVALTGMAAVVTLSMSFGCILMATSPLWATEVPNTVDVVIGLFGVMVLALIIFSAVTEEA